jgi:hypothetical protein
MRKSMRFLSSRALWLALAGMFVLSLTGDRGVRAAATYQGIDPLLVLSQTVKNNVLFIVDTSGSMKWPIGIDYSTVGDDDPFSRAYKAKSAVRTVVKQHLNDINMGIATYDVRPDQKAVNRTQNFTGGPTNKTNLANSYDGPFVYVTNDPNAAAFYGNTGTCIDGTNNSGGTNQSNLGFFCGINNTFSNYDPTGLTGTALSTAIYQGFGNSGSMATGYVDPNCTSGNCTRYYLQSRLFYSGVSFAWNHGAGTTTATALSAGPTAGVTCGTPPAGLTGDWNDDGVTDPVVPCLVFHDNGSGKDITFWYTATISQINIPTWTVGVSYNVGDIVDIAGNNSYICTVANVASAANQPGTAGGNAFWSFSAGGVNCAGASILSTVAACTANNSQVVLDSMRPAIPIKDVNHLGNDSSIVANSITDYMNTTTPTNPDTATGGWGLRFDQGTPLKAALDNIFNASPAVFPAQVNSNQKNFVILLTDGDDTCADSNLDTAANLASQSAQALLTNTDFTHQAETFVVTLGSSATRAGKIAVAGSGGPINTPTCPLFGQSGYTTTCTNAYPANSAADLVTALNNFISIASTSGTFAASQAVIGTVFELDDPSLTPSVQASQPGMQRYQQTDNTRYLATFDLPKFEGHLIGFLNASDGTYQPFNSTANGAPWDAGAVLKSLITTGSLQLTGGVAHSDTNGFTFAELHGGLSVDTLPPMTATTTAPAIKRRIFTSQGNGTFLRDTTTTTQWNSGVAAGRNLVALWPPSQTGLTAPAVPGFTNGLDPVFGIAGDFDVALGLATVSAGVVTPNPMATLKADLGACDNSTSSAGTLPANCTGTVTQQNYQALKEARETLLAWLAGAQVARGSDGKPLRNTAQALLYTARPFILMDCVRSTPAISPPPLRGIARPPAVHLPEWTLFTAGLHLGTQPTDQDLGFGQTSPDQFATDPTTLKPRMTTVFMGASDGMHAFGAETGIEMWSYVPFDQLSKIYLLARDGQSAANHKYMVAASGRTIDVFMPATSFTPTGTTTSYSGRWRTVLVFGRGAGGKYHTMLDVTAPGPYTRDELRTNPPWVLWSRGNPDTIDGTGGGTAVSATDTTAYSKMGETWALPEIGNVASGTPEWRMFVGSGYSSNTTEGSTFYAMDVITGNVIASIDVAQGIRDSVNNSANNAMPANPTGYNASLLDFPDQPAVSADVMTRVYQPDIQGRIWKFLTATNTLGAFADGTNNGGLAENSQPFGNAVNLLNQAAGGSRHLVFAESGNDNRVSDSGIPFRMFAWDDTAGDALTPKGVLMDNSQTDGSGNAAQYPIAFPAGFRGSSQPAVAFTAQKAARVFFLGTRFNSASNVTCASSFDSIIFGLGAVTGGAAYDFGPSFTINNQLLLNVSTQGGVLSGTAGAQGAGGGGGGGAGGGCNNLGPGSTDRSAPNLTQVVTKTNSERLGSSACF